MVHGDALALQQAKRRQRDGNNHIGHAILLGAVAPATGSRSTAPVSRRSGHHGGSSGWTILKRAGHLTSPARRAPPLRQGRRSVATVAPAGKKSATNVYPEFCLRVQLPINTYCRVSSRMIPSDILPALHPNEWEERRRGSLYVIQDGAGPRLVMDDGDHIATV